MTTEQPVVAEVINNETEQKTTEIETKQSKLSENAKSNLIHKIPSQRIPSPKLTTNDTINGIKINNGTEKIQHTLINNWIENGFIENIRGQIRSQLICELRHPFKHQNGMKFKRNKCINHLSLSHRILNCIIINYLETHPYNYSLSVFKSEIGGELIGSLSLNDTYNQLHLKYDRELKMSILEQLIQRNTLNVSTFNQKINEKQRIEMETALKTERNRVKELQKQLKEERNSIAMDESTKLQTKHENKSIEWRMKYQEIYNKLMNTLKKENELQCLLDESNIKLNSANREINYLEKLLNSQNNNEHKESLPKREEITQNEIIDDEQKSNVNISVSTNNESSPNADVQIDGGAKANKYKKNNVNNVLSDKYEKLELDLKKRLQIQAMLETDTRKLTVDTKQFLNQLNLQKNKTNEIITKLENTTPRFDDNDLLNKYKNLENEWEHYSSGVNIEKQQEFESMKKRTRQSRIYYNLDKLQKQRHHLQRNIRNKLTLNCTAVEAECKECIVEDYNENEHDSECSSVNIAVNDGLRQKKYLDETEIVSIASQTITEDDIEEEISEQRAVDNNNNDDDANKNENEDNKILDDILDQTEAKTVENTGNSLDIIEEDIDENERERIEREKLEDDLLDDYMQSESFSGIDFLQNDFLLQYQKHIENMNMSD